MDDEHKREVGSGPRLVRDKVMASMIGVSVSWLQKDRVGAQLIPFVRLGDLCLYDPPAAFDAIRARQVGGSAGKRGRRAA